MSVNVLYTTSAIAVAGRDGNTGTSDGFEANLVRPKEFGGRGDANNPEQLFASAYAACFLSSMQFLAAEGGARVPADAEVMATVGIGSRCEGDLGLEIALDVRLPGLTRGEAEALVETAHQICPCSKATRNNVAVKLGLIEA